MKLTSTKPKTFLQNSSPVALLLDTFSKLPNSQDEESAQQRKDENYYLFWPAAFGSVFFMTMAKLQAMICTQHILCFFRGLRMPCCTPLSYTQARQHFDFHSLWEKVPPFLRSSLGSVPLSVSSWEILKKRFHFQQLSHYEFPPLLPFPSWNICVDNAEFIGNLTRHKALRMHEASQMSLLSSGK